MDRRVFRSARLRQLVCSAVCITTLVGSGYAPAKQDQVYQLPVRVYAISSNIPPLNASFADHQIRALISRANEIWHRAGIVWQLQSIERYDLPNEDRVIEGLQGRGSFTPNHLLATLMSGERDPSIWNIYLVGDLSAVVGVPGVYVPELQSLTVSQNDPAGERDPGRILAHELGHSLALPHIRCTPRGNLMAPGCAGEIRTRLKRDQIKQARAQAATGQPDPRPLLQ